MKNAKHHQVRRLLAIANKFPKLKLLVDIAHDQLCCLVGGERATPKGWYRDRKNMAKLIFALRKAIRYQRSRK